MYYGGLRSAGAKNLTAEKVNLDLGIMLVRGKGNKERVVPVIKDLRSVLEKRFKEVDSGLLWPRPSGGTMRSSEYYKMGTKAS